MGERAFGVQGIGYDAVLEMATDTDRLGADGDGGMRVPMSLERDEYAHTDDGSSP